MPPPSTDGKLLRLFTQNIDGLDLLAFKSADKGLVDKILPVHGSLAVASCEFCGAEADFTLFQKHVREGVKDIYADAAGAAAVADAGDAQESKPPLCAQCGQAGVKPSTVLYGRSLPEA